jgi:hypothetical protein
MKAEFSITDHLGGDLEPLQAAIKMLRVHQREADGIYALPVRLNRFRIDRKQAV